MASSCSGSSTDIVYPICTVKATYKWNASINLTKWERQNASQAKVTFTYSGNFRYNNVDWTNDNDILKTDVTVQNSTSGKQVYGYKEKNHWGGCQSQDNATSGTGTKIQGSDAQWKVEGRDAAKRSDAMATYCSFTYDVPNNYRVLPPTGLSATAELTEQGLVVKPTLASWSANSNIKGTPYTGSGGRNWNYRVQIYEDGALVGSQTYDEGENKSPELLVDGATLKLGKTYTIEVTVSNDYQQTISTLVEISAKPIASNWYIYKDGQYRTMGSRPSEFGQRVSSFVYADGYKKNGCNGDKGNTKFYAYKDGTWYRLNSY